LSESDQLAGHISILPSHARSQALEDEVYLLSLAVECGLALAALVAPSADADANMGDDEEEDEEDDSAIPALTLAHVSTLLAPLLRQTVLARFAVVARAPRTPPAGGDKSSSSSSSSSSASLSRPVLTEAEWAHVHATEAPAVRAWWTAVVRRLPADAALGAGGGAGGAFDVPGVRRQLDGLLQSAALLSAHAFDLRENAAHECRRAALLSVTLCGMAAGA
jgi:hypothetical protein